MESPEEITIPSQNIDKDEWQGSFWEVQKPLPINVRLKLNYLDGRGNATERSVNVRQFGELGTSALLIGHCLMRNATRTFRIDRISNCVDEDTGELVKDIPKYLMKKYENSPEYSLNNLLEDEYDTLRVLLYVGKADGQLRAAEKAIIRETCVALSKDSRLTDKAIDNLLSSMNVPSLQAFKLAVGRLAKREKAIHRIIYTASEKMIATQKTVHHAEQDALDYMRKRFGDAILDKD